MSWVAPLTSYTTSVICAGFCMPFASVDAGKLFATVRRDMCWGRTASQNPSTNRQSYKTFLKYARSILATVEGQWDNITWQSVVAFAVSFRECAHESKATSLMVQRPFSCALVSGHKKGELRKTAPPAGVIMQHKHMATLHRAFLTVPSYSLNRASSTEP